MPPVLAPLGPNLGPSSPTSGAGAPSQSQSPQALPATSFGQGLRRTAAASSPTANAHPYRSPSSTSLTAMTTPTSSGGIIHPPHSLEHLLTARRQLTMPMVDRAKYHRFLEQRMAYYISLQPSINATADRLHAIVDSASAPTNPRTAPAGSPRVPPPVNTCMSSSPLHHASPPQLMSGSPAATASRSRGGSTDYTVSAAAGASSGTAGAGIAYIRRQRTGSTASINSTATATGVHAAAGAGTGAGSGAGGGEGSTDGLVFNLSMTDLTAVGQQQQQQQLGTRRI